MRCPGVPFDPGPSHGGQIPTEVICHRTYGSYPGDYNVGKGSRGSISFHFLVGPDEGEWVQFVSTDQVAYHAKGDNRGTIGIEVSGRNEHRMTDWQVRALGHICRWISQAHGIPLVKYHGGRTSSFHGFRDHADVAGSDHTDGWTDEDWARIVAAAGGQEADDMTPEQAQQLAAVNAAMGRVESKVALLERAMAQSACVLQYDAWGQHIVILRGDGSMVDYLATAKDGWVRQWDTGPRVCDPDGGIVHNNAIDNAIHITARSADKQAAIRVVYAPWEQMWRPYERIG